MTQGQGAISNNYTAVCFGILITQQTLETITILNMAFTSHIADTCKSRPPMSRTLGEAVEK